MFLQDTDLSLRGAIQSRVPPPAMLYHLDLLCLVVVVQVLDGSAVAAAAVDMLKMVTSLVTGVTLYSESIGAGGATPGPDRQVW